MEMEKGKEELKEWGSGKSENRAYESEDSGWFAMAMGEESESERDNKINGDKTISVEIWV